MSLLALKNADNGHCTGLEIRPYLRGGLRYAAEGAADEHRLTILSVLMTKQAISVCDLTAVLPLNQPTVSHHLKILRDARLVTSKRCGTWVYYRLAEDVQQRVVDTVNLLFSRYTSQPSMPPEVPAR